MAFDVNNYLAVDLTPAGENVTPPQEAIDAIEKTLRAVVAIYPQLSGRYFNELDVAQNIAYAIAYERSGCFYNALDVGQTSTQKKSQLLRKFAPVITRFPNIAAAYTKFSKIDVDFALRESESNESTSSGETATNATTEEKFNPVSTPYSKLSGKSENSTNGTATNAGSSTTTRIKNPLDTYHAIERAGNPMRGLIDAICAACVFTPEELEENYYLGVDDCED